MPGCLWRSSREEIEQFGTWHPQALDVRPPLSVLERLARLTNHDPHHLSRHTLIHEHPGWPMEWFVGNEAREQNPIDQYVAGSPEAALCPLCVNEMRNTAGGVYLRREWSLTWSTMCRRHGIPLIDRCPCGAGPPPLRCRADGGCEFICPHCDWRGTADIPTTSVLAWHWLTAFEGALLDAMDGRGLNEEWGGPATSEQLHAALSAIINLWGFTDNHG